MKHGTIKALLIIFALILPGCSGKTLPDDWPGIDDIKIEQSDGERALAVNSFNLDSKIVLPKIGKDISYSLSSTCHRTSLSGDESKAYKKTVNYKPSDDSFLSDLYISTHVPEEVLIYPKHFELCHFTLTATNPNGSKDSSNLTSQRFNFLEDSDFKLKLNTEGLNFSKSQSVFYKEDFNKISVFNKIKKPFNNLSLSCHSKEVRTVNLNSKGLKNVTPSHIVLPKRVKGYSIENCIFTETLKTGKTLISSRVSVLNEMPDERDKIKGSITSFLNEETPQEQILYRNSEKLNPINILTVKITNNASEAKHFEISPKSTDIIKVINSYIPIEKKNRQVRYKLGLINIPIEYTWNKFSDGKIITNKFSIPAHSSIQLNLEVLPQFLCADKRAPDFINSETGFIIAPKKDIEALSFSETSKNEFISQTIKKNNIFSFFKINDLKNSNLPKLINSEIKKFSNFQFLFKNKKHYPNQDIVLKWAESPRIIHGRNGEPINLEFVKDFKHYPYRLRQKSYDSCESPLSFLIQAD